MSRTNLSLPPGADALLPSQHRTARRHYIDENIDSLTGVDSIIASRLYKRANMNSLQMQNRYDGDPVLVSDYLRVRTDETLALHPVVSQCVAEGHHDQLLKELVRTYHERLLDVNGPSRDLEPVPGFPEPALDGLNSGYDLAYRRPEFEIAPVEDRDCDGRKIRPTTDYPIEIHDILADLRTAGVVTNLAKSGCEYCGREAGRELANQLRGAGHTVNGYAGVAAEAHPDKPLVTVQDFEWSAWKSSDVVDLVEKSSGNHGFRSKIRIENRVVSRSNR